MKNLFSKLCDYVPEFFILVPVVIWTLAFLFNTPFLIRAVYVTYWWGIYGLALWTIDFLHTETKKFLR